MSRYYLLICKLLHAPSQPTPPLKNPKNPVNPDSKPLYRINPNYPHG
jgi:hypothetical protein